MATNILTQRVRPYAGQNDALAQAQWAEKKWVWVTDKEEGFLAGYIVKENGEDVVVHLSNDTERAVKINDTEKMNPPKFDKVEDMADLTYLNEASVVSNLRLRYYSDLIYTYSGLFLVTVNPYKKLPIYSDDVVKSYKGKKRSEMAPHIYSISDQAYFDMLNNKENQSILITGESGAGKTENTKKVIQYLASIAGDSHGSVGTLEQKILQANPILESFGNAQTIRNNNSSRFGKFIRIEFNPMGQIVGANIERYLLEKSRVTHQTTKERSYHIFYQLMKGASPEFKKLLLLDEKINDYNFMKNSNKVIEGVDDAADFKALRDGMDIMGMKPEEQMDLFRSVAGVLHLGNLHFAADREDQALMTEKGQQVAEKVCHVLGIPVAEFTKNLLKPKIKAGRDLVTQARNVEQVSYSVEALARALYERMFAKLIDRINEALYTPNSKSTFIGVLDIAGFEIFDLNSFEQLCINYTNEKLQQFFNHHMFILEQEEYKREGIEWKFIDFGLDLQPTIELIEKTSPIGILSCLDEECVMPKASDKTFIEKLHGMWKGKSPKYEVPRFNKGFILHHYAGKVEYNTDGWLDKNKDPLNENVTRLLANSSEKYIADLFADSLENSDGNNRTVNVIKKGAFRTVAQRHKEQLISLMNQLYSTEPHFVRCIIPNEEKKPRKMNVSQVLEQLRCNGVLEGIRICRAGFPNRVVFADFRQRYELLASGVVPKGFMDGRKASQLILEALALDQNQYRIGNSKVFFRAGVLAALEEKRDVKVAKIVTKIQSIMRGHLSRKVYKKRLDQLKAIKIIQRNARVYVTLREWAWWKLYTKVKPLLNVTRTDEELRKRDELAKEWEEKYKKEQEERLRLEAHKAQLEAEKKKIEEFLLQEKHAAADQAEILSRTQKRQLDLTEQLNQQTVEMEEKDAANEELTKSRKKLESDLNILKQQLSSGNSSLDKLEKDRFTKEQRLKELEEELKQEIGRSAKIESDKKAVESELTSVNALLDNSKNNEADLTRQKAKLASIIADTELKLEQETEERNKLEHRKNSLENELKQAREQIAELSREKAELEALLKKKDLEIHAISNKLNEEISGREAIDKQKRELQVQLGNVTNELENEKSEREKLIKQKLKIQAEAEHLAHLMEEKGSEESRQSEIRKLRENDLNEVKAQLAASQVEFEEIRKKSNIQIENLRSEIEASREETNAVQKLKSGLEKQLQDLEAELENTEEAKSRVDKARRQHEIDLSAARGKIEELETSLNDTRVSKEALESQLTTMTARLEESESVNGRLEREKNSLLKQIDILKEEVEEEVSKKSQLEGQKKKISAEYADLQVRLDEEEVAKGEALKRLSQKTSELEALKERYAFDVQGRTVELEEARRKLEGEVRDLDAKCSDFERNVANLEKTKARLNTEIEDLKLEIEREHQTARNAERLLKQVESQVTNINLELENERRQRETVESNGRKLQNTVDSLQNELEERVQQIASVQKSKGDLENELKALINEIGDGGKNVHELEKLKRRLESRIEELESQLEEEQSIRQKLEEAKNAADNQMSEYRRKTEESLQAKDAQMEETRKMLLKEVNMLGNQLDEVTQNRGEVLRAKKKLEEQIEGLTSKAEYSAKGQTDLDKARKKAETAARELQAKYEEEERNRKNFEELAQRHEKKANSLQSEIERLEVANESNERSKKLLEKTVQQLNAELYEGEDSKPSLIEAKKKLERQVSQLEKQLEEVEDARAQLESIKLSSVNELENLRSQKRNDVEGKLEKLEESRRALLASQRLQAQELEGKTKEIINLEKQKKTIQAELDAVKFRLEEEVVAKGEDAAARRKLAAEFKELQLRLDAELAKNNDLTESTNIYKAKADQAISKVEALELARQKAEKSETNLRMQLKDAEAQIVVLTGERDEAEQKFSAVDEKYRELTDKIEEDSQELNDANILKRKLQEELEHIQSRHRQDLEEREVAIDASRKKYQKEIKQLISELEIEKNNGVNLKEINKNLERDLELANNKVEIELRSASAFKKDKERLETRVDELSKLYQGAIVQQDELQGQITTNLSHIRELKSINEDVESQRLLAEKAKKTLEHRLEEIEEQYTIISKNKTDMTRSIIALDAKATDLRDQLEENQDAARNALEKYRRSEQINIELQNELNKEKDINLELEKSKMQMDKQVKELTAHVMDLEASNISDHKGNVVRLEQRVDELTAILETETKEKAEAIKQFRKTERIIRELQFQLTEKDRQKARFDEDIEKMDSKLKRMKTQIDEMESTEGASQLAKRRAEREATEFRDKCLRLEKENQNLMKKTISSVGGAF